MPRLITIGYGDREGYERTPENVQNLAHAHDESLKQQGALIGVAGSPVQVRNTEASGVQTQAGPFMSSQLPVAGFAVIEAENAEAAVRMAQSRVRWRTASWSSGRSSNRAVRPNNPSKPTPLRGTA